MNCPTCECNPTVLHTMQIQVVFCAFVAAFIVNAAPLKEARGLPGLGLVGGALPLLGGLAGGIGRRTAEDGTEPLNQTPPFPFPTTAVPEPFPTGFSYPLFESENETGIGATLAKDVGESSNEDEPEPTSTYLDLPEPNFPSDA
ncbi:hypothetical protein DL96DRAFT_374005 [Flagelloscypha sp. PMI_526]|nr:hypothetical protein DL96DRAFT_374005 [Flagelloscypha sp. PMI_526]